MSAFFLLLLETVVSLSLAQSGLDTIKTSYSPCLADSLRQTKRSLELQDLVNADQADRLGAIDKINWAVVAPRDLKRRMRVAEIFAEGCFRDAKDYAAAATVFQHGDVAEHAFQTFLWAKQAVELGDPIQNELMAMGLDRYLVRTGQKQLFATQGGKDQGSPCWCLEPVEGSFPEGRRMETAKRSIAKALSWIRELNAAQPACAQVTYCNHNLKPSPQGTVPGFW